MGFLPFVAAAAALFHRRKAPRPPEWQTEMGQLTSRLAQQYLPQTMRELWRQAHGPAGESLYMQQLRQQLANQQAQGTRQLSSQLAQRGLFAPETVAGAMAAYQSYAGEQANQALMQAALQEEQLRRSALAQLAQLASGTGGQALQAGSSIYQQQLAALQLAQQQEEALAMALAPLLAGLFRKKPAKAATPVATAPTAAGLFNPAYYTLGGVSALPIPRIIGLGLGGLAGIM